MSESIPILPPTDQKAQPLEEILWPCLVKAIKRFNKSSDRDTLLCARSKEEEVSNWSAANETAIAHRLGFYLERELRICKMVTDKGPIAVDCEYNRHLLGQKKLQLEKEFLEIVEDAKRTPIPTDSGDGSFELVVRPDLIVHERQANANYLVIEVKKRSSTRIRKWEEKFDALKLTVFTRARPRGYGYLFGAWVVVEDDCDAGARKLRITARYQNGEKEEVPE